MIKNQNINLPAIPSTKRGNLEILNVNNCRAIQCHLVEHYAEWVLEVKRQSREIWGSEFVKVCIIDPAYNNTGCELGYELINEELFCATVDFDDFMRDGFIFLWVVNCKMDKMVKLMSKKGWKRIETISWNKYDKFGRALPRGGHYAWHVNEYCLVFTRKFHLRARLQYMLKRGSQPTLIQRLKVLQ